MSDLVTAVLDESDAEIRAELDDLRARLKRSAEAQSRVDAAELEYERLYAKAKAAKKILEAAIEEFREVSRMAIGGEDMPLFDGPKIADTPADWRDTPLSELGLSDGILSALAEHVPPILCVGHLADFTSKPNQRLGDIKGIGPAKVEQAEAALIKFWETRKDLAESDDDAE
jgi:multidrug efflux pump subunit AcrA (membrane-fusion protein)